MKELMIGNEAIARGAFEAGATVAAAYPGTPSTEIVSSFAKFPGFMRNGHQMKRLPWRLVPGLPSEGPEPWWP